MTKLLLERLLRICCFTFLGVLVVLVLTACGPGGGGTGTGPTSYSSTVSVAGGVGGGSGGVTPNPPPGGGGTVPNPPLPGDCTGACAEMDLHVQEGRVELVTGCGRFVFVGGWEVDANGLAVLPGMLESQSAGTAVAVTLRLQFGGTPEIRPSVTVTVVDAAGHILLGPKVLGQAETFQPRAAASGCPT